MLLFGLLERQESEQWLANMHTHTHIRAPMCTTTRSHHPPFHVGQHGEGSLALGASKRTFSGVRAHVPARGMLDRGIDCAPARAPEELELELDASVRHVRGHHMQLGETLGAHGTGERSNVLVRALVPERPSTCKGRRITISMVVMNTTPTDDVQDP